MAAGAYVEFAKRAFAREGTYRPQVFTHIGSVLLRVFLLSTLWTALYRNNGAQAGISLSAMITYATFALLLDLIYGVNGAYIIREKIREGSIAIDLMRPISVPLYVFADTVGQTSFAALQIIPALLLSLFLVHLNLPSSPVALLAFIASVALGFVVNFFLDLMMATITFWTMEIFGVQLMVQFISSLLSGSLVPLYFFPAGLLQQLAFASPFAAIYNAPLSIYIGKVAGPQIMTTLGFQVMWAVIFGVFAFALWRVGERRVVIQGG
ncbi:MAG TPA: ABC-2 family transporter protein [Candidatus Eremiobacteraceae bacterium]|nr:ABC-2 family transporter protein [Candidatus Eremiobacteraceae bacterium]